MRRKVAVEIGLGVEVTEVMVVRSLWSRWAVVRTLAFTLGKQCSPQNREAT